MVSERNHHKDVKIEKKNRNLTIHSKDIAFWKFNFPHKMGGGDQMYPLLGLDKNITKNHLNMFPEIPNFFSKYLESFF